MAVLVAGGADAGEFSARSAASLAKADLGTIVEDAWRWELRNDDVW